jgi:hypothetical protein
MVLTPDIAVECGLVVGCFGRFIAKLNIAEQHYLP